VGAALEVAGAFASELEEGSASHAEVLRAAAEIAARAAPRLSPDEARTGFRRASLLLGSPAFEVRDGKVRAGAAFDAVEATSAARPLTE
jgi:hypothetical protein